MYCSRERKNKAKLKYTSSFVNDRQGRISNHQHEVHRHSNEKMSINVDLSVWLFICVLSRQQQEAKEEGEEEQNSIGEQINGTELD